MLDASVALSWSLEGQKTAYAETILDFLADGEEALVPVIWPLEIVNSLVVAERRRGMSAAQVETLVRDLANLPLKVDLEGAGRAYSSVLRISRQHQLSAYDATYLDLALFEALPLATLDKGLRAAAKRSGVELFNPGKG